jgi:hypothetical protein
MHADASTHRIISDISSLIDSERNHRILLADDFNILYGYGDNGSDYWKARYESADLMSCWLKSSGSIRP